MNPLLKFPLLGLLSVFLVVGCTQKAPSPEAAIETSKMYPSVEKQTDYLNNQANYFLYNEKYQAALQLAQYVITHLDKNSTQAKAILEKAKAELQKIADRLVSQTQGNLNAAGQSLNSLTEDIKSP